MVRRALWQAWERVPSFSTIVRVSFADHPQAVFIDLALARGGGSVRARLIRSN